MDLVGLRATVVNRLSDMEHHGSSLAPPSEQDRYSRMPGTEAAQNWAKGGANNLQWVLDLIDGFEV